jgi:L-amino acid N-acyltransferase YncA
MTFVARAALVRDAAAIAAIYNEGIVDRIATFETEPRSPEQIKAWSDGLHPVIVVEGGDASVVAFASTSKYRDRTCYAGIAEFSVYVGRSYRGTGAGHVAMTALINAATKAGFAKLVSRIFPENAPSLALRNAWAFVGSAHIIGTESLMGNGAIALSWNGCSGTPPYSEYLMAAASPRRSQR